MFHKVFSSNSDWRRVTLDPSGPVFVLTIWNGSQSQMISIPKDEGQGVIDKMQEVVDNG